MRRKIFYTSVIVAIFFVASSCSKKDHYWESTMFNISGTTVQLRYEVPLHSHSTVYCMTNSKKPDRPIDLFLDSELKMTIDERHCNKSFETDDKPHIIRVISDGDTQSCGICSSGYYPMYFSAKDRQQLQSMTVGDSYRCSCEHYHYMSGNCAYRLNNEGVCTVKEVGDHILVFAIAPGSCELQISPDDSFSVVYDVCTINVK